MLIYDTHLTQFLAKSLVNKKMYIILVSAFVVTVVKSIFLTDCVIALLLFISGGHQMVHRIKQILWLWVNFVHFWLLNLEKKIETNISA